MRIVRNGGDPPTFVRDANLSRLADDLRDVFCLLDCRGDELFELSGLSINVHGQYWSQGVPKRS